ncbi:hypothetical protein [Vulcanococcus sp.]|jgi:hypothetical protein|uniref:hypothetical protein n=1 Tax=Vulcanococcus sp. TaxID=2856995 RepID=UPI003502AC01
MASTARGHQPRRLCPQADVQRWQDTRTWARLIREAEALWHVDVRDLRRLGALELSQLLEEVPPSLRPRVNRWLRCYRVTTRLH